MLVYQIVLLSVIYSSDEKSESLSEALVSKSVSDSSLLIVSTVSRRSGNADNTVANIYPLVISIYAAGVMVGHSWDRFSMNA